MGVIRVHYYNYDISNYYYIIIFFICFAGNCLTHRQQSINQMLNEIQQSNCGRCRPQIN